MRGVGESKSEGFAIDYLKIILLMLKKKKKDIALILCQRTKSLARPNILLPGKHTSPVWGQRTVIIGYR